MEGERERETRFVEVKEERENKRERGGARKGKKIKEVGRDRKRDRVERGKGRRQ